MMMKIIDDDNDNDGDDYLFIYSNIIINNNL